jgi:hypothetical protein
MENSINDDSLSYFLINIVVDGLSILYFRAIEGFLGFSMVSC